MSIGEKTSGGSSWSRDDDIAFENALSMYTDETQNRWGKIAEVVPGKTLEQVIERYESLLQDVMLIESGCVPLPEFDSLEGTPTKETAIINRKCESTQESKPKLTQRRRKGIAWTQDEHSQFLLGLEKYGKGDWRSISRHLVVTRTPTQVASHAQKYFARLNSKNKNNVRQSIYDVNVGESGNTMQIPNTWQNTQAIQTTSQQSQDYYPTYDTSAIWNTQSTSHDHYPKYDTPAIWNTQVTSQQSLDRPMYGTPNIWNIRAASQPYFPIYGTPTVGQSMLGPMVLPSESDLNRLAPAQRAYGVQHHSAPYSLIPSAPFNMGPVPYNMPYIHTSH
ncbi:unnamed protein product [Eruca vesicaria subsp. sativa]|uniref:Uncharacterized protein n=1 Tax=Eruca vesicaria subsp. sativa TaxID=29727 RepID=A0ABC8L6P4_ERUVS|nr:unnamed protein product [Eruca vesicaria subsp. sativa]